MSEYKFAIIGHPLSHSLSNVMQKAALKSCELEGDYEVLDTKSEDLINTIKKLKTQGYNGFNVTIPHKVAVTLFLEQFDEYANLSGAVNTVKILSDRSLFGYNTDVYGFINSLPENFELQGSKVAIIGTGGASRAVCTALNKLEVSEVDLFSRNIINSHEIVNGFRNKFSELKINLFQTELLTSLSNYKMVINATPLGMKSFAQGVSPLSDELIESLSNDALVYDIVYNPVKTKLVEQAIKFDKKYVGGLDMLVLQGARAFEIWTGVKPDVNLMKVAVLENLI